MKKYLLMAAVALMAATGANAQSRFEPGTLTIQPRIGGTGSMLTNTPDLDIEGFSDKLDATATGGAFVGADLEYQLTERFSVAAGVNYAMAGSGWEDADVTILGDKVKLRDMKIETGYVNVPLTVNWYVAKGLALKTGVQAGFLTNAKMKMKMEESIGGGTKKTEYDEDCKDEINKFDVSIPVGLSYEFKIPFVIDARFNIGLTKVNKESDPDFKDSRNLSFVISFGYKFKL